MEHSTFNLPEGYTSSDSSSDSNPATELNFELNLPRASTAEDERPFTAGKKPASYASAVPQEQPNGNAKVATESDTEEKKRFPLLNSEPKPKKPSAQPKVYYLKQSIFGAPVDAKGNKIRVLALTNKEGKVVLAFDDFFSYIGLRHKGKSYTKTSHPSFVETAYYDSSSKKVIRLEGCIKLAEEFSKEPEISSNKESIKAFLGLKEIIGRDDFCLPMIANERPEGERVPAKKKPVPAKKKLPIQEKSAYSDDDSSDEYNGESTSNTDDSSSSDEQVLQTKAKKKKVSSRNSGESHKKSRRTKRHAGATSVRIPDDDLKTLVERSNVMVRYAKKSYTEAVYLNGYLLKKLKSEK